MSKAIRYLMLIGACLAVFSFAWAETVPARILIGASEAPLSPAPIYDGAGVLAPQYIIQLLGASCVASSDAETLFVTSANGDTATIKTVEVSGTRMVPVDKLIALIGGEKRWNAAKRTLTIIAHLNSIEFDNDVLTAHCSFPVRAVAKIWDGKIILDIANTKVMSEAKEVYIGTANVQKARLGQPNDTTARIVLDLNKPIGCKLETTEPSAQISLRVGEDLTPGPALATSSSAVASNIIEGVTIQGLDDRSFNVVIATSGKIKTSGSLKISPPQIVIDLQKAKLADSCAVTGTYPCAKIELSKTSAGVRLVAKLARPLAYSTQTSDTQVTICVRPPDNSDGKLSGKFIVIDPGHGGTDSGAQSGGAKEKNLNIQLSNDLAAALTKLGAKVELTRDGDYNMGLKARPELAAKRDADFFISLHCNSNLVPNSASGIETYYHMQEPSPKILACAIHDGVCKFTGMCDRNPRSDRSLYESGLAVLRGLSKTGIPGILLECGYINNESDRKKLLSSDYRAKLVAGIIAGLTAYIEGTPIE